MQETGRSSDGLRKLPAMFNEDVSMYTPQIRRLKKAIYLRATLVSTENFEELEVFLGVTDEALFDLSYKKMHCGDFCKTILREVIDMSAMVKTFSGAPTKAVGFGGSGIARDGNLAHELAGYISACCIIIKGCYVP